MNNTSANIIKILSNTLVVFFGLLTFTPLLSASSPDEIVETPAATWDNISYMGNVKSIVVSEDGKTLWEGTSGGLKLRDIKTGKVLKVYISPYGPPENHMESLLSDGAGGLWMGTLGGLAHFDGKDTWKYFNQSNSDLPSDSIGRHSNALVYDDKGCIWIATAGGLAGFDPVEGKWQVFNDENSPLLSNNIQTLMFDKETGLWIGTWSGGLAHYNRIGEWELFHTGNSILPGNEIFSILSDGTGGVWIGAGDTNSGKGGLAHFDGKEQWKVYNQYTELSGYWVRALLPDGNGGIWIGFYDNRGLAHLSAEGSWKLFNTTNSDLPADTINTLVSDSSAGMWIGTWKYGSYQGGLVHFDGLNSWTRFNNKNDAGLPDNYVYSLLSDNDGGIWLGTDQGLAHYCRDQTWQIFNTVNSSLLKSRIEELVDDGLGGFWIGSSWYGIAYCNGFNCMQPEKSEWLLNYSASALLPDMAGGIWAGGFDSNGLYHYNKDRKNDVILNDVNSKLPDNRIRTLTPDNSGGIWAGTANGLAHYTNKKAIEVFKTGNASIPSNTVTSLLADSDSGVWVGTNNGLAHFDGLQKWTVLNNQSGSDIPLVKVIYDLMADGNNGFWMSGANNDFWASGSWGDDKQTLTGGTFAHYDGSGNWIIFDRSNSGIPPTVVFSFAPDGSGGFWLGTMSGIAHLSLLGSLEHVLPDEKDIHLSWFLNRTLLENHNVKYIELQRSLARNSPYETVRDSDDNPVRFYVDYTKCPNPRSGDCWPAVEGHEHSVKGIGDNTVKGYRLSKPVSDPEWLEGVPRYYRLSAVIEKDGRFFRAANNQESVLMTPRVEENPRVELTLDRSAIAVPSGTGTGITVFVSSLDLFAGDVTLEIESDNSIFNNFKFNIAPSNILLNSGETKPVLLNIEVPSEGSQFTDLTIKIIPKIQSGYSGKSTSLNIQTGTSPMIALSIAQNTKRPRVMDSITVSGNVVPVQAGQKVEISGNHIRESMTVTTNAQGFFEGAVVPTTSGTLTVKALSNGISDNAETFILPARTHIALTSDVNQATSRGDTLRVKGIITPVRLNETKASLDIRYLDPADAEGDPASQFVGDVVIDEKGMFYKDIVVPGDGFINLSTGIPETSDFLGINTQLVIPIGQPVGEGIIVVSESGTGSSQSDIVEFYNISKSLGRYVYNSLRNRNIPPERIRYLGIADDPGLTNGNASRKTIHDALTNWATSLFATEDPYKTPLNLYLIGKVEDGSFRLNDSETLTAEELSQYLDEAEAIVNANNTADRGFPVTIVLEGAQSGRWINKIAGLGRIILTSSSDKPVDDGGYAGYDNLGETSFSRYFYQFTDYGLDIEGSFAETNYEILNFYRHTQRPVMDADGDGAGRTTDNDRYEASSKFIEYRPSGNLRPQIKITNPDMTINRQAAEKNTLWAIATDPENEMQGVFCSITDPSNRTVNIEMNKDTGGDMYTAEFNQYPANGCYQAVYYAKDKAGNVSLPEQKFLNVVEANSDVLPQAPQMKITTQGSVVTIAWSEVADGDGYRLFYAPYPAAEYIGEIDMGKQREVSFDGKSFAFYAAVKGYNTNGFSELSNIEWFDLK